jgi:hypothetical protein
MEPNDVEYNLLSSLLTVSKLTFIPSCHSVLEY